MKKRSLTLGKIICILSGISSGVVLIVGFLFPPHNLLTRQMLPAVLLIFLLILAVVWGIPSSRKPPAGKKSGHLIAIFFTLLLLFGGALFFINLACPFRKDSLFDYAIIYANAESMARKAPLEVPLYYRIALNNFKPTLILSFLLRIADLFHLSDPYPFFVFLSVFWVLVTVICTCFLIKGTNRWKYRIVLLLLFILTLPVSVHTGSLYTDSMTFGTASVCIFLLNTGYQTHCAGVPSTAKINSVIPLSAIAGILCSVGFAIKVTVIIPFIAASVVFLLYSMQHSGNRKMKWADLLVRILLPFFFCFGLTSLLLEVWAGQYEDYTISKNTCEPVISYIALGLTEDGSFAKNSDFAYAERYLETKSEKAAYSMEYIKEHADQFVDPDHLIKKTSRNFSGGFLGADDFVEYPLRDKNILHEMFHPWGSLYWRTSQYCFIYIQLLYLLLFTGSVLGFICIRKEKKIPYNILLGNLSFFGIFLFLTFWEANNRQLYNQLPILLLSAVCTLSLLRHYRPFNGRHKTN